MNAAAAAAIQTLARVKSTTHEQTLLEPIQAMFTLACVAFLPKGTKLCIKQNTLHIDHPSVIQPVRRWLESASSIDLLVLGPAIQRFISWYRVDDNGYVDAKCYRILIKFGRKGVEQLLDTYSTNIVAVRILQSIKHQMEHDSMPVRGGDIIPPPPSSPSSVGSGAGSSSNPSFHDMILREVADMYTTALMMWMRATITTLDQLGHNKNVDDSSSSHALYLHYYMCDHFHPIACAIHGKLTAI